jgi:hypothetical protein
VEWHLSLGENGASPNLRNPGGTYLYTPSTPVNCPKHGYLNVYNRVQSFELSPESWRGNEVQARAGGQLYEMPGADYISSLRSK